MLTIHKLILCGLLLFLGLSLVIPGLIEMFRIKLDLPYLTEMTPNGINQHRALYGMMAGIGLLALGACFNIERSHNLVLWLGTILAVVVAARIYSLIVDGMPGKTTLFYLGIETVICLIFLLFPPYTSQ